MQAGRASNARRGWCISSVVTPLAPSGSGKLQVPRAVVLGFALVLAGPVIVSIAHAEESEAHRARAEMNGTLAGMTSASRQVREMLREARRRGVKPEVLCLDETLSRADVARRSARVQAAEALDAYVRSDVALARVARHRVAELAAVQRIAVRDANVCVPHPAVEKPPPGTFVRITIDPSIAPITLDQ